MGEWWVKGEMRNSILTTDKIKAIFADVKEKEKIVYQLNKLEAKRRAALINSFGKTTAETLSRVSEIENEIEETAMKLADLSDFFNKLSDKEFKIFQMYFQDEAGIKTIMKECKVSFERVREAFQRFEEIYPL